MVWFSSSVFFLFFFAVLHSLPVTIMYWGSDCRPPHHIELHNASFCCPWFDYLFFVECWQFNCREMETCMVRARHTPLQPLQNHPSGYLKGWATPWSAEDIEDSQHQRVDIPAHARTAHKGLVQKSLEEDLCWIVHRVPHDDPTSQGTELNWT